MRKIAGLLIEKFDVLYLYCESKIIDRDSNGHEILTDRMKRRGYRFTTKTFK